VVLVSVSNLCSLLIRLYSTCTNLDKSIVTRCDSTDANKYKYTTAVMMKIFLEQALLLVNRSRVIIFKPIDTRLWVLRIRGEFKSYHFICAHVPMEENNERQMDRLYETKGDVRTCSSQYKNYVR